MNRRVNVTSLILKKKMMKIRYVKTNLLSMKEMTFVDQTVDPIKQLKVCPVQIALIFQNAPLLFNLNQIPWIIITLALNHVQIQDILSSQSRIALNPTKFVLIGRLTNAEILQIMLYKKNYLMDQPLFSVEKTAKNILKRHWLYQEDISLLSMKKISIRIFTLILLIAGREYSLITKLLMIVDCTVQSKLFR